LFIHSHNNHIVPPKVSGTLSRYGVSDATENAVLATAGFLAALAITFHTEGLVSFNHCNPSVVVHLPIFHNPFNHIEENAISAVHSANLVLADAKLGVYCFLSPTKKFSLASL
jgi:hypothetical protein